MMKQKVALIVKDGFENQIDQIADHMHVWSIQTPGYTKAMQSWHENSKSNSINFLEGCTIFQFNAELTPEEIAINILETIDEHHGENWTEEIGQIEKWSEIHIYGVKPTNTLSDSLREFNITNVELTSYGIKGTV